jgi:paraquat-inducible protein B
MNGRASPTAIGGFVLGAAALVVAGITYFGSGQFLAEKHKFVLYFSGSLTGLQVGAPVNFRGVKVGSVSDIVVRYDTRDHSVRTPVYIEVESDRIEDVGDGPATTDAARIVNMMIEEGLRAQLAIQSLVTGQLAVQLDFDPNAPLILVGADPDHIELPTVPSRLEELERTIAKLPVDELIEELRSAVQGVDAFVHSDNTKEAIRSLDETLDEFAALARHIGSRVDPVANSIEETAATARDALNRAADSIASTEAALNETLAEIRSLADSADSRIEPVVTSFQAAAESARLSLEQFREAAATANDLIAENSALHYELVRALGELSAAARSVRVLADYLEQNPDALLRGKTAPEG